MEDQQPEFGFNVQRILDCGFAIEEAVEVDPENTVVSYAMNIGTNIEENWVQINIRADLSNSITNKLFATGTVLTQFGINNLRAYADPTNIIVTWPPNSMQVMFGIAFGHMRAILAKNMAGSKFSHYVIPLINPGLVFDDLYKLMMKTQKEKEELNKAQSNEPAVIQSIQLAPKEHPKTPKKKKAKA